MVANSTLNTNFNVSPWYDDYDADKHFYRLLFNPEKAVQARELTQSQTILQNQIRRFGDHIFKEGSLVSGGQFNLDQNHFYVKLKDLNAISQAVNELNFVGTEITGSTTGVKAVVIGSAPGSDTQSNTKTLFVKYTGAGYDTTTKYFLPSEIIVSNTGFQANIVTANTAVGVGSSFSINAGVVYAKTFFVDFEDQEVIIDRYNPFPTAKIGFNLNELIITHNDDITLNDPAQGSYNYAAPGADRFSVTADLVVRPYTANTTADFIELFSIKDGVVQEQFDTTQYSLIRDELARRTEDESGDYYVKGLDIRIREHLDDGTNQGYLTLANGGNTSLLAVGVEAGKAYVKGYDIETLVPTYLDVRKGIDTLSVTSQNISTNYGNYVYVNELVGSFDFGQDIVLKLYNTAQKRLTNKTWSTGAQTGTQLGTARFKALEYVSGTMGTPAAVYKLYLTSITMTAGDFSSVKSIYCDNGSTADIGCDIVLNASSQAVINDSGFNTGIYPFPQSSIKSVRGALDTINTEYTFMKSFPVTIATSGTFSLSTGSASEIFTESAGVLNTTQEQNFIVTLNGATSVSLVGTVTTTSGSPNVTGSGTSFTGLNVGDKVEIASLTGTYYIASITSNTIMALTTNAASSVSGQTITKVYKTGDIIDFSLKGTTGTNRTITVNTSTTASFDMKETLSSSVAATISTRLNKTSAREIKKTLRRSRYVIIDCSTAGTTGPFDLGIPDVFQIQFVRKGSSFTTDASGTDVTSGFTFDNGQRDNSYEHARLIKNSISLSSSDKLLVKLDYFYHDYSQGIGYFSVDSYPIDDAHAANTIAIHTSEIPVFISPVSGTSYSLQNCIDTRPSKQISATDSTTIAGATTNPVAGTSFDIPTGGLHTPAPNQNFILDYSYYLPRKDLIVLSGNGNFRVVEGVSNTVPVTPNTPVDAMAIGTIRIAPYPSLSPFVASQEGRNDLACSSIKTAYIRYTMRDIGVIKSRVDNLEYYASLNLLEQNAINLKVPDENGLDRFKNGIFVDPFQSHAFGNLANPDYNIAIDSTETCIRPIFDLDDVKLDYFSGTNVVNANGIILLNYTETPFAAQPYATTNRNTASQFWKFVGQVTLTPPQDFWTDTTQSPDVQVNINSANDAWSSLLNAWGTQWNDWQTTWTGVPVSTTTVDSTTANIAQQQLGYNYGSTSSATIVQGTTTTTTTNSTQTRTGTQVVQGPNQTTTTNLGSSVIDTSLIPYIRPQIIEVYVSGLKTNTTMYVFFDDEAMNDYCTQTDSSYTPTKSEGQPIVTDVTTGEIYFLLRLPASGKQFRVGTKKVRITDSITNEDDAMSSAEGYFVASGLNVTKQDTIISTTTPTFTTQTVTESKSVTSTTTSSGMQSQTLPPDPDQVALAWQQQMLSLGGDPIAQSFVVSLPSQVQGIFATSIDLYFQNIDADYDITVELRALDSGGNLTSTVIPYGTSSRSGSTISTSDDGTVATRFYFKAPVFLVNGQQYAFVIKPEANNPNFYVFSAKLGENDLKTGFRVTSQPYVGVLYVSSNNTTWTAVQDEDIKFTLNRAKFITDTYGTAVFKNNPIEKLAVTGATGAINTMGESIRGSTRVTLANVSGGTIANTYIVRGVTSGAQGQIDKISGSVYRLKNLLPGMTFTINENVTVLYANNASTGITGKVQSTTIPYGTLQSYDSGIGAVRLKNSTGSFEVGEQIFGQMSNTRMTISNILPIKYSVADYESSFLDFDGTSTSWEAKGTANTAIVDSTYSTIQINDNNQFMSERAIYGNTQELALLSGQKSLNLRATLYTNIEYLSPVIDLNVSHTVLVHNIVNNVVTGETSASGGAAINKYISQTVTLADQQDAEDMVIYISGYRPPDTEILVYTKILHGEDSGVLDDRNWVLMELTSNDFYSSSTNTQDYREFTYKFPDSMMTGSNGEVQYVSTSGVTFTGYKYFAIKIVLISSDSAIIPKVADLRCIALQM